MNQERIYQVLLGPHISEKASLCADLNNQYVFKVATNATKLEIRKAVEQLFKVKVSDVSTAVVKGKVKRNKFGLSRRAGTKKAYVRLAQGQEIDFAVAG
jgi:large subunit ribosomal protein L23